MARMARCSGTGGFGSLMESAGGIGGFADVPGSSLHRMRASAQGVSPAIGTPIGGTRTLTPSVWGQRARHVRFHSLPRSKQYADTDAERAEVLRRHLVVLSELLGSDDTSGLVCIAADYGRRDWASGWTRTMLPGSWPWRAIADERRETTLYFWAACHLTRAELEHVLAAVADDDGRVGRVAFTNSEVEWLYCPYDGGADVVLPTSAERDRLKALHADWLPAHPEGL